MKRLSYLFILLCLTSCKDEPLSNYIGKDGIVFYYDRVRKTDAITYSFQFNPTPVDVDTVWLDMRLVGKLSDSPRRITVKAAEHSTAKEGVHFRIVDDIMLPANQYLTKYPVVVLNAPGLDKEIVALHLDVSDNEDLEIGATGDLGKDGIQTTRFNIYITNQLIKPIHWEIRLKPFLGIYSKKKYEFVIATIGTHDLDGIYAFSYADLINLKAIMKNALQRYERENGPLIDENNEIITFPN